MTCNISENAQGLAQQLVTFLAPCLVRLDAFVDTRLMRTFVQTIAVIITFRHCANGLLLSELGAYLESPAHAPAGTKRLSNLLHCPEWASELIERDLGQRADQRLAELEQAGEEGLVVWDESVIEKPESIAKDRLVFGAIEQGAPTRAHQTRLLQSTRGRPIFVLGMNWLAVLLLGRKGPPVLAAMRLQDDAWAFRSFQARRRGTCTQAVCRSLGTARTAYV